ncbi:hypothetical protein ARAM_003705 [Aspergillus rambellii]|uniref:Uncharacterized protein n=1 Tax=Aspergillus rambellii TaxID=308745 RepID=A0A0F8VR55_9EURO|nr:hypothetical protein ARAM_003705 [Aspergillus rambellii]
MGNYSNNKSPCLCLFLISILVLSVDTSICGSSSSSHNVDSPSQKVIGVHLGSTNSRVGAVINNQPRIFTNPQGTTYVPSYVAATDSGLLVGEAARRTSSPNLFQAMLDMKQFNNDSVQPGAIEPDLHKSSNTTYMNIDGRYLIQTNHNATCRRFAAEEIYAALLADIRYIAEAYVGPNITGAIVTVPGFLDESEWDIVRNAGVLADLPVFRIAKESSAVSMAYGLTDEGDEITALSYDLGAHHLDISLMEIDYGSIDTVASSRKPNVAGESFNRRVLEYFSNLYMTKYDINFTDNTTAVEKLMFEIEKAKLILSFKESAQIEIPDVHHGRRFSEILTRHKFEELNMELFEHSLVFIDEVLQIGNLTKDDITDVVLAGGSCHIPKIQGLVHDYLPNARVRMGTNPDEAAIWGAILHSNYFQEEASVPCYCFITHPQFGIGTRQGVVELIPACHDVPAYQTRLFSASPGNPNNTLIQIYARRYLDTKQPFVPDLVAEELIQSGDPKYILLGEGELPTIQGLQEKDTEIEITAYLSRHSVLKVRATNKQTSETKTISFSNLHSACGQARSLHVANFSYIQNSDLRVEYESELRSFVGSVANQLQVWTRHLFPLPASKRPS